MLGYGELGISYKHWFLAPILWAALARRVGVLSTMNPEAAPNAACLKVWDELTPSERAFAQTLGLDEASWPKWYERSSALERGDEDDENERNWPEEVVRHSARTAASWVDLAISEREAAQQLGYDQGLWAAFCCSEDDFCCLEHARPRGLVFLVYRTACEISMRFRSLIKAGVLRV